MLVLDQSNSYPFANMVVRVTDNTVIQDDATVATTPVPKFNVLIPTVQDVGLTNTLELYQPGMKAQYVSAHGEPNALKYGFGPDFICGILDKSNSGVGVYHINLRGPSATMANVITLMKYRIEENVPYMDSDGNPYYVDDNGQLTIEPTDNPIIRNVLHVMFTNASMEECKKWTDLHKTMSAMRTTTPDEDGYYTIPFFGVMYRGATTFGNNVYFNMTSHVAEYDNCVYYALSVFDGLNTRTTDAIYSLYSNSGAKYGTSYFIETMFNDAFPNLRFMASEYIEDIYNLFNQYLFTVDDYIAGATTPSKTFEEIDPFNCSEFMVEMDEESINAAATNAFKMANGDDGTETADELFEMFFNGEILTDINSTLRYKVHYIPDVGYNDATKQAIISLVQKRIRMTSATIMCGNEDTFNSAMIDHQANYYETMPNIRQLAKIQSPMMFNPYVRRTMTYPCTYFDTMALMDHFAKWSNYFQPFAGADARWTGFIEDTMVYPPETVEYVNTLYKNRINVVMKDDQNGAYLSDQQMNTVLVSDQTEFNNAFLISSMLYDLLDLVHRNHFKFNEADDVRKFNNAVNDSINMKYSQYSASLSVDVYRVATVGRAKSANKIVVHIDMKDINKYTDVDIILDDN